MSTGPSNKVLKWLRWIDPISNHLIQLHHDRAIWRTMILALNTQACGDYVFEEHYTKLYVDASAAAVRRLAEVSTDPDAASLGNLVKEIGDHPHEIRLDWFLGHYTSSPDSAEREHVWSVEGARVWKERFGSEDGRLDVARVEEHLAALSNTVGRVKAFADRMIAHLDRRGPTDLPTFDDLDASVDLLGELFKHYALLLSGSSWVQLEPTIQSDWQRPFRSPVFEPLLGRWLNPTPPDVPEPNR